MSSGTKEEAEDKEHSKSTVFVSSLPYTATSSDLEAFASDIGPIRSCYVVADKEQPGRNRGVGYIVFALHDDAVKALLLLKKKQFMGKRTVKLEWATKKKIVKERKAAGLPVNTKVEKKKLASQVNPPSLDEADDKDTVKAPVVQVNQPRSVIIGGLSEAITLKDVRVKARKFGTIRNITYPFLSEFNELRMAKVDYSSYEEAETAIDHLDKHVFKGIPITAITAPSPYQLKRSKVIIRNLPFTCTIADLITTFKPYGIVSECTLPTKPDGKTLRGFGFVQYLNIEESEKAVNAVNGTEIKGRKVAVDFTLPKDQFLEEANRPDEEELDANDSGVEVKDEDEDEEMPPQTLDDSDEETNFGSKGHGRKHNSNGESDDEDVKDEDDGWEDVDVKPLKPRRAPQEDVNQGCTLFIRNLSFDTNEEDLTEAFSVYGNIRYARTTFDASTGQPRGTGFVCFYKQEDAQSCIKAYEKAATSAVADISSSLTSKSSSEKKIGKKLAPISSVLAPEPSLTSASSQFVLNGRLMNVTVALPKGQADKVAHERKTIRIEKDKRNLYLMREGVIFPNSDAAKTLSQPELETRMMAYGSRKRLLTSNPNLFLSKTRLSVRNLGLKIDDAGLRNAGINAVKSFWKDVEEGKRQPLENEVMEEDAKLYPKRAIPSVNRYPKIKQAKILVAKDRVNVETGKPRSKGYGFLEFETHADALAALRWMNNNSEAFGSSRGSKIPIVEFSIENAQVVKRRDELLRKSREKALVEKKAARKLRRADKQPDYVAPESNSSGDASTDEKKEQKREWKKPADRPNNSYESPADGDKPKNTSKQGKPKRDDQPKSNAAAATTSPAGKRKWQDDASHDKKKRRTNEPAVKPLNSTPAHVVDSSQPSKKRSAPSVINPYDNDDDVKRPRKKQQKSKSEKRDDDDEAKFEKLVNTYKKNLFGGSTTSATGGGDKAGAEESSIRRWFA
ncbi:hypothetical protein SmJEL517_g05907 [Synchytrium microbalum]|uniref:RRM domain-containing protein n=1 Tax=Synchytrium microbalum TaxID=1806994 RepID=A0A507BXW8_9FUNG|nr:uncharacterized protein SmJEL517_g05907 [Synchytrium microbalum]TPX30566.1 hypothetical protein SmJEL517_g05907 [Synchytrium microbalum]